MRGKTEATRWTWMSERKRDCDWTCRADLSRRSATRVGGSLGEGGCLKWKRDPLNESSSALCRGSRLPHQRDTHEFSTPPGQGSSGCAFGLPEDDSRNVGRAGRRTEALDLVFPKRAPELAVEDFERHE